MPGILGSVEVFARRQPALFMGATVALGFALTRFVGAGPVAGYDEPGQEWRDRNGGPNRGVGTPGYGPPPNTEPRPGPAGASHAGRHVDGQGEQHLMPTAPDSRSVGELLRDLAGDSASLVRQEFALARTEAQDKLHQTITASTELVVGALVALAALIVLLEAAVYGLTRAGLEHWLAALIVGGVVGIVGFVLVRKGQNELAAPASRLSGPSPASARTSIWSRSSCLDQWMDRYRGDRARARRYAVSPGCHDRGAAAEAGARNDGRSGGRVLHGGWWRGTQEEISGAACATIRSRWP